jgi:hypothetical protein
VGASVKRFEEETKVSNLYSRVKHPRVSTHLKPYLLWFFDQFLVF